MPSGLNPHLPRAADDVLVRSQLIEAHGAAGVEFAGADADFRAKTEFAAVGEAGRGVPVNGGRIDFVKIALGRGRVVGDD